MSVRCGIWNGQLTGPVFYERTLTTMKYIELTLNGLVTAILKMTLLSLVKGKHFQEDRAFAQKANK